MRYISLKMAEFNAFLPGKRKTESTVNLCFVKKAHVGNYSNEEGQNQQQNEDRTRQSAFADITEDIFIKICSYLSFREVVRLGRVCRRWYNLTKSPVFWQHTDLVSLNLPPQKSQRLLMKIPPCVRELRIGSCSDSLNCSEPPTEFKQTLSVPALYNTLSKRFPALEVLIIENSFLAKASYDFYLDYGFMLNCKVPEAKQVRRYYTRMLYETPTPDTGLYTLISMLQDITVLSLRGSVLAVKNGSSCEKIRNTPSRIRVLDLTQCSCAMDQTIKLFCQLPFLEELYLAGTAITVNGVSIVLQEVHRLKVLDLDNTVVSGETFAVLKKHGQSLVKLYLGKTTVKDCDMVDVDEETFPFLEELCLQSTSVSDIGVRSLLYSTHSLKHIILTKNNLKITWMFDLPPYMRAKVKYHDNYSDEECNHFLQNKFPKKYSSTVF